ncbi:MAG: ACT domain-containing protein, partial [Candidatus Dadabacteria bacterium]|nr:ACT domain-containing protein [Candidatus Dadabacteria bacterium]
MKQIVVVSGNRIGVIADISGILSGNGINIERLDTSGSKEHGAVILTTDNYDKALKILNNAGFKAVSEDALVVRLENKPGSLAEVSGKLKDAGVNIRSMHIIQKGDDHSLVAIATEENERV